MPSVADRLLAKGSTVRRSHTGVTVDLEGVSLVVTIDEKPMEPKDHRQPNFATKQISRVEVFYGDIENAPRAGQSFIDSEAGRKHRITRVERIADYYECDCEPSEVSA